MKRKRKPDPERNPLEVQLLTGEQRAAYSALALPAWRTQLTGRDTPDGFSLALGATLNDKPVGLILAQLFGEGHAARILNFYVAREHRAQGIGGALLTRFEAVLRERGCEWLHLGYLTGRTTTAAVERLLAKQDWQPPVDNRLIWKAQVGRILEAPWMAKPSWPQGYEVFLWRDRTPQDQTQYQQMRRDQEFPSGMGPAPDDLDFEPLNSLGLRHYGRLTGWMITRRISAESIRYAWMWTDPTAARVGRGVPLVAEAVILQAQQMGEHSLAVVGSVMDNEAMVRFVRRRAAPYLLSLEVARESVKQLRPDA